MRCSTTRATSFLGQRRNGEREEEDEGQMGERQFRPQGEGGGSWCCQDTGEAGGGHAGAAVCCSRPHVTLAHHKVGRGGRKEVGSASRHTRGQRQKVPPWPRAFGPLVPWFAATSFGTGCGGGRGGGGCLFPHSVYLPSPDSNPWVSGPATHMGLPHAFKFVVALCPALGGFPASLPLGPGGARPLGPLVACPSLPPRPGHSRQSARRPAPLSLQ